MTKRVKLKLSARLLKKKTRKKSFSLAKHCRFCSSPEHEMNLDYKNANMLKGFLTERGKILPLRISGNCRLCLEWHLEIWCPLHRQSAVEPSQLPFRMPVCKSV